MTGAVDQITDRDAAVAQTQAQLQEIASGDISYLTYVRFAECVLKMAHLDGATAAVEVGSPTEVIKAMHRAEVALREQVKGLEESLRLADTVKGRLEKDVEYWKGQAEKAFAEGQATAGATT